MPNTDAAPAAIRAEDGVLLASLELSQSSWLVTVLQPSSGKFSKFSVTPGDTAALLTKLRQQQSKAERRCGHPSKLVTIYEAGLDGFWLHRLLTANGIENHVVDPGSIAAPRRKRRAKTDRLDGEALIRVLASWLRREPRVCSMVAVPTERQEDERRLSRERQQLMSERTALSNRIKGLLISQGVRGYDPVRRDRRARLEQLTTGDGRALPAQLKAEVERMLERLELTLKQLKTVEAERDALLKQQADGSPLTLLLDLRSLGNQSSFEVWSECLYRQFANRRQVAAYAGLAPTPWRSGSVAREQGLSQAGNPRVRKAMIQLAWLWLRNQPDSALAGWFRQKVAGQGARTRRMAIVGLARRLLIALWRYVNDGVVPEGAVLKSQRSAG
jgi:transposase